MRVLTVVGARPQFIKAAVLSAEFRRAGIEEILVHTGQHYDPSMSDVFFEELPLPAPAYRLDVGSGAHGEQTGEMMKRLEPVMKCECPDWVAVYGDTNSTLAGALVASKLRLPTVHVEAGLRSFNREMPEEINRIVADHVADLLCAPNAGAAERLRAEGIEPAKIAVTGDLMIDLVQIAAKSVNAPPALLQRHALSPGNYAVLTIHRAGNTEDPAVFERLIEGIRRVAMPVIFPVHPRTRALVKAAKAGFDDNIIAVDPLSYRETIALLMFSKVLLTDSGGMQKEAFALRIPCVTLRDETEWIETLEDGWNVLAGADPARIARAAIRPVPAKRGAPYGNGDCARRIVDALSTPAAVPGRRGELCAS